MSNTPRSIRTYTIHHPTPPPFGPGDFIHIPTVDSWPKVKYILEGSRTAELKGAGPVWVIVTVDDQPPIEYCPPEDCGDNPWRVHQIEWTSAMF